MSDEEEAAAQLFEEIALDDAVEQAADALRLGGGGEPSAADLEAARARAQEIAAEMRGAAAGGPAGGPAPDSGAAHAVALTLAIGMPLPRVLFGLMVDRAAGASASQKKAWHRRLKNEMRAETGCLQVDFFDSQARAARVAFLVLAECGADHDLGAELDRLYARTAAAKHDEIRRHLSMLVYLGRTAYAQMAAKLEPLLDEVAKKTPGAAGAAGLAGGLDIDAANTTFHVQGLERRVGILVRFADEP